MLFLFNWRYAVYAAIRQTRTHTMQGEKVRA